MKNRRLIISLLIFFFVVVAETYVVTYPDHAYKVNENGVLADPDLNYYVAGGRFGTGHDLTIAISQPLARVSIYLLPIFFFFVFVFGTYYMIKPFVKYSEWAFIMAPLTLLTTVLAQIFSVGLFWFVIGFYFRYKNTTVHQKKYIVLMSLFLFLVSLAHFWSGICLTTIFAMFLVIDNRYKLLHVIIPSVVFLVFMGFVLHFTPIYMFSSEFLQYAPGEIPTFFTLFTRQMSFLFTASIGILWLALYKEYGLLKILVPLLVVPISLMLFLPYDWVWRLFYFMPLLAFTSIVMSYWMEGKKLWRGWKHGDNE